MTFYAQQPTPCMTPAAITVERSSHLSSSHQAPVPMFRTYSDVRTSRAGSMSWPRQSLSWLKRQRWLIQQSSTGQWLENLVPCAIPGEWTAQWNDRVQRGLQFATEEMGKRVYNSVAARIGSDDIRLTAVTFVAPPSDPTYWRPLDEQQVRA